MANAIRLLFLGIVFFYEFSLLIRDRITPLDSGLGVKVLIIEKNNSQ